jgi:hypothetical protein
VLKLPVFSSWKNSVCWQVSGQFLVAKRNASSIIVSCLWWTLKLTFEFGIFSKKNLCIACCFNNLRYNRKLKIFQHIVRVCQPGIYIRLTTKRKMGLLLLSCTLSDALLCLLPENDFITISLSSLNSLTTDTDFYLLSIFHGISASSTCIPLQDCSMVLIRT